MFGKRHAHCCTDTAVVLSGRQAGSCSTERTGVVQQDLKWQYCRLGSRHWQAAAPALQDACRTAMLWEALWSCRMQAVGRTRSESDPGPVLQLLEFRIFYHARCPPAARCLQVVGEDSVYAVGDVAECYDVLGDKMAGTAQVRGRRETAVSDRSCGCGKAGAVCLAGKADAVKSVHSGRKQEPADAIKGEHIRCSRVRIQQT